MNRGALKDLRVIDLTTMLAGPYCTQILADHGANVIKIETLLGDNTRRMGPYTDDDECREFGGYFQSVNRNKLSIAIDLKTVEGKQALRRMIDEADIVVENFRSGVMERLGLSYESLRETNSTLVYATIRGFGDPRSGESPYAEWPAFDVVSQAMGGIMGITGPGFPMKIGPGVGDTIPAMMLVIGILAAVHHAQRTGEGQFVDVAMTDSVLALCERIVYQQSYEKTSPKPEGNRHPLLSPFGLFPAKDGWVAIACPYDDFWKILAPIIGRPELAESPEFATNEQRVKNMQAVVEILESYTSTRSKAELAEDLGGKVPFGPVFTAEDIFNDPHFRARQMIVDVPQPGSRRAVQIAGVPIKMSATPGAVRHRAPLLGEQTDEILASAGYNTEAIQDFRTRGIVK